MGIVCNEMNIHQFSMRKEPYKPVFLIITELLRNEILYGDREPGSPMVEKEIAENFKTSRAPVRESFRILEGEGLIIRNNPVGYKVRELELTEFIERNILLKIIEKELLFRAVPRYTELDLCQMDQMVEKISKSESLEHFIKLLIGFTDIIYQPTGWNFSIELIKHILHRNIPFYKEIARQYIGQPMQMTTHKKFVDLCRQRKVQEAIECWVVRYDNSEKQVFSLVKNKSSDEWMQ
jgi:DNA-binding GntR family transcriptional regulator